VAGRDRVEYGVLRWRFSSELTLRGRPVTSTSTRLPVFPAIVVGLMLVGFVVASSLGVEAAWVAGGAALVLAVRAVVRKEVSVRSLGGSLNIPFIAFVLGLGIVVMAVVQSGSGPSWVTSHPRGTVWCPCCYGPCSPPCSPTW